MLKRSFVITALVVLSVLAPTRAHAEVQAGGVASPPFNRICAYGVIFMTQVENHIAVMGFAAPWGSVGNAICNTWYGGKRKQIGVSWTLWKRTLDGGRNWCGAGVAYPGWQTAVTDVLDLRDPATGSRTIEHAGCGPGWYQAALHTSFKDEDGVWHHGWVTTPWDFYFIL